MSGKIRDLNQAWDLYYHVFRKISRQLPQLTSLELQYVSPKLLSCKNLELAVPGSYTPGQELIRISSIHQNLHVIIIDMNHASHPTKSISNTTSPTNPPITTGHHIQAASKKAMHSRFERKRVYVPVERSRRLASR